jgi:hypothetical protein
MPRCRRLSWTCSRSSAGRRACSQAPPSLRREKLPVGDSGGQVLVIYHAEPGSDSARSLVLLGSLAATDEAAARVLGQPACQAGQENAIRPRAGWREGQPEAQL